MSRHPTVKWAQRSDKLYITIDLPDAKDVNLKLDPEGKFFFSATSGADSIPYEIDIDLFDKVDVNESKASIGLRNIRYLVKKAESKWWSRLLKQEGKPPVFLKVDWDKWVDEDEQEDSKGGPGSDFDDGDFDFSKLNMGGMGGPDDFDDDDDAAYKDEENDDSETEEENAEAAPASGEAETKCRTFAVSRADTSLYEFPGVFYKLPAREELISPVASGHNLLSHHLCYISSM